MASDTKDLQAAQFDVSESTGCAVQEDGVIEGSYPQSDPRYHTDNIKRMLRQVKDHVREDISKVSDPKAQVLFEVTAEVLQGLMTAYDHYETKSEPAMR